MSVRNQHEELGARIRKIRTDARLTADELAAAAQRTGLKWDRSTVSRIESGGRVLTWWELVNLPAVFSEAGYLIQLSDVLDSEWLANQAERFKTSLPDRLRKPIAMTEVERRAAKSLGVKPRTLDLVSWRRWGKGFIAERDERAGGGAEPARRWASRRMLDELREHVDQAELQRLDGLSDEDFDVEQRRDDE